MKHCKLCVLLLALLVMSLCLTAFAADAKTAFQYDAAAESSRVEFDGLTITSVEYADPTATDSTLVGAITKINYDGGAVEVDNAKFNAVMTVDGAQTDIKAGTYTGKVVIELVSKMKAGSGFSKFDNAHITTTFYTTAAAVVADGKLIPGYSVSSAFLAGENTDTSSVGAKLDSNGSFFGGYYITNSKYAINGLRMSLLGFGGDDFQGWGAGVVITDGADVTMNDAIIETKGVIRTAIWVGGTDSKLDASDVVVMAYNDNAATAYSLEDNYAVPMMEKVPFALGLAGNIRATNVLGSGTAKYTNSIVVSNVWGALSTDSGRAGTDALIVTDTLSGIGTLEVAQKDVEYTATKVVGDVTYGFKVGTPEGKSAGYVTYADAGVNDWFYNVDFYAPDYIGIIASGTSNMHFDKDCYGWSGRCGFLIHQNGGTAENGGGLYLTGGKYEVADQFILVKGGAINNSYTSTNVNVDGADVSIFGEDAQSGVFFQLMQSDDAGSPGATEYTINDMTPAEIAASQPTKDVSPTTGTFANMTINGDIYNSVANVRQTLDVTLDKVVMNGSVSAAYQYHVDEKGEAVNDKTLYSITCFDADWNTDYRQIGRIVNVPSPVIYNGLELTLKNGTVWNVTGSNYLSKLTIDDASSLVPAESDTLYFYVDNVLTEAKPGTYEGNIMVSSFPMDPSFTDVASGVWYYEFVTALAKNDVVNGYPEGSFKPSGTVTYGEALKLVAKAAGLPEQEGSDEHWAAGYLALAQASGVFTDVTDLNATITRGDVADLAAALLGYEAKGESPFTDTDSKSAIALFEAGILNGYEEEDGTFTYRPEGTITRAEISKIVYVMMGLNKEAPVEMPVEEPAEESPVEAPAAPADPAAPPAPPAA